MFQILQNEIENRILAVQSFFRAVRRSKARRSLRTAKGLLFVQLYAIYEYTITTAVRAAITEMKGRGTPLNTIRMELMGLILKPEFTSVMECGREKLWERKLQLFPKVNSPNPMTTPDDTFPESGAHCRDKQLRIIWSLFGISKPIVPHGRLLPLIEELVANRNAVAHGRETAEEVGRRHSTEDMAAKINRTQKLCLHIARTLQQHCSKPSNLQR